MPVMVRMALSPVSTTALSGAPEADDEASPAYTTACLSITRFLAVVLSILIMLPAEAFPVSTAV